MSAKKGVLFVCNGNSCRSQMAEGWARHLRPDIEAHSAGITPGDMVDPRAIRVMGESGVDISHQHPKHIREVRHVSFDLVITLCSDSEKSCPAFATQTKVIHAPFDDPPALAFGIENDEELLAIYRRVRDQIREFVEKLAV